MVYNCCLCDSLLQCLENYFKNEFYFGVYGMNLVGASVSCVHLMNMSSLNLSNIFSSQFYGLCLKPVHEEFCIVES